MTFQVGDHVGDYEIVSVLGAGGMGKVYKVRNIISERVEAMKVLLPNLESDPDLADRFIREIKVQASLDHPNIAGLHTAQRVNNQLLMFMEFVEGVGLDQQMHAGPIPIEKGVEYISQALSALAYAHARGVVHRDIKPANMMLTPSGTIKLMDFGIAKMAADPKLTQTGHTVGSLYYMSPEQINGAALDARSDLYSLGVSLYEVVTGTRPFKGDSDFSIMAAHLHAIPVPPVQIDPKLPSMLNEIVMMSIARDPAQRFQSADAFRNALQALKLGPAIAPPFQPATPMSTANPAANPVAAIPSVAPQIAVSHPSSRRGLYMALGSLATIAVVVVAAVEGPKWFAPGGAASATQVPVTTSAPPQTTPAPVASAPPVVETPSASAPAASTTTAPGSTASAPGSTLPAPGSAASAPAPFDPAVPKVQREKTVTAQRKEPPNSAQVPPPAPQRQDPPKQPAQADPNDDAKATATALRDEGESLMLLDTRANSIKGSLDTLQQQQARSGLNLRGDIVSSRQRMEAYLNEADASLKSGDPARAKKNMNSAEREIEKLEKFLGR
jgi:eukaryotic-like serine/threonine-protein kinase